MTPWLRPLMIAALLAGQRSAVSHGQVFAEWVATGAAAYHNDSHWSVSGLPAGAPGSTPDTPGEAARFRQPTGFTVELTPGTTTAVGAIEVSGGAFAAFALDPLSPLAGDALLSTAGPLTIDDAQLELTNGGGGPGEDVTVTAATLQLDNGGRLVSRPATLLNAGQTVIAAGSGSRATSLEINGAGTRRLGGVTIGTTTANGGLSDGAPPPEAELTITSQARVEAGDLLLAAGAEERGVVNIFSATLHQVPGASLTIGAPADGGTARLLLGSDGEARFGSGGVTIHRSGSLQNTSARAVFEGDLTIAGGSYTETAAAERSFAAGVAVRVEAGGVLQLADQPLSLDGGQSLAVRGGRVTGDGGLALGPDAGLTIELLSLNGSEAPLSFEGVASLTGELTLTLPETLAPGVGDFVPLVAATGFSLSPTAVHAPPLPAGLGWELRTVDGQLRLVVGGPAPGDANGDLAVNAADYAVLRDTAPADDLGARLDQWRRHFGRATPPDAAAAASALPEPGAAAALALLSPAGFCRRRRPRRLCHA